ncbi:hypothetical protein HK096_002128 [Nowakowskiella sp. JEL0078]|nr:hypothetical protein HK096_002128 [Nowakowskiella sp. JEL0078]
MSSFSSSSKKTTKKSNTSVESKKRKSLSDTSSTRQSQTTLDQFAVKLQSLPISTADSTLKISENLTSESTGINIGKRFKGDTEMLRTSSGETKKMDVKGKGVAVDNTSKPFDAEIRRSDLGLPKKLVIKSLKVKPKLPENFEEDTWEMMKKAIRSIYECKPIHYGMEELYKACEHMCQHKMAESLYRRLNFEIDLHVKNLAEALKLFESFKRNLIFGVASSNLG